MKNSAFSTIDLLLGLLVLTAVFMLGMNTFKQTLKLPLRNDVQVKSIQEHIDEQVSDIEEARQKSIEFEEEMKKDLE